MPIEPWQDITAAELAQDKPLTTTLALKFRAQLKHLKQFYVGDGAMRGQFPHAHRGIEDGALTPPFSGNFVKDFCPDTDGDGRWVFSGYTTPGSVGIRTTTTAGHYALQILMFPAATSKATFGSGADLTVSFTVTPVAGAPTAGELWFGIADGGTTHKANCKGVIAASGITTAKRYYMQLTAANVGSFSTDCRVLIKNGGTPPDATLNITGVDVRAGLCLPYTEPSMNEDSSRHDDWANYSVTNIYSKSIAITNATLVVGS